MHHCQHCELHMTCLDHVPIFHGLEAADRMAIARTAASRSYDKSDMIYTAGEAGGRLFVLHTGQAKQFRLNPNGREQVIRTVGPGDFVGELSLFSGQPLSDNLQALSPATCCMLDGAQLRALMAREPKIAFKVMAELSQRLATVEERIEAISLGSVGQRVARALLELAGGNRAFELPLSKGDWASQLGMSQETLSRKLSALQEEGLIGMKGLRRIIIRDREALERLRED